MKQHHWLGYALAVGAGAGILSAVGVPLSTLVIVLAVLACPLMMLMMLMHGGQPVTANRTDRSSTTTRSGCHEPLGPNRHDRGGRALAAVRGGGGQWPKRIQAPQRHG